MGSFLLSSLIFGPIFMALLVLSIPKSFKSWYPRLNLLSASIQLLLSLWIYIQFSPASTGVYALSKFQFLEQSTWFRLNLGPLGEMSVQYLLGVDGLSIAMVLLCSVVMWIGAISSFTIVKQEKAYFSLYLLLSSSIMGCFLALDFFLFYLFFEFMLLPMYFLIGIWGGERREYASIKFFLYTLLGSLLILMVMIGLYLSVIDPVKTALKTMPERSENTLDPETIRELQERLALGKIANEDLVHSFSLMDMMDSANYIPGSVLSRVSEDSSEINFRFWAFLALAIGFLIKMPAVPLHTWLPDAHVEAPTPVSVVLAGILLKVGAYGLLRITYPIFPAEAQEAAFWMALIAVISIIYGAMNALAMSDWKKMVAYSSVSHMGFVLLGIASLSPEGVNGAIFQMFSHGLLSAMLFLLVGVLYDQSHNRDIQQYRGLISKMPVYGFFVAIAFFASLGLPGFSGFIGEVFTLLGAFSTPLFPNWLAVLGVLGIILGAAYFLWTFQKLFLGEFWLGKKLAPDLALKDLNFRESFMLSILAIGTLLLGIMPGLLFGKISYSVEIMVQFILGQ